MTEKPPKQPKKEQAPKEEPRRPTLSELAGFKKKTEAGPMPPKYTPEQQKIHVQRGGSTSGASRRGAMEKTEKGEWRLTETPAGEKLMEEARKEMEEELAKKEPPKKDLFRLEEQPPAEARPEAVPAPEKPVAPPEAEKKEEKEIKAELEKQPEGERKKLGIGVGTLGFLIEEQKDKYFAKAFNVVGRGFKEKGTMRRFFSSLSEIFSRDAKQARKNIDEVTKGKSKRLSNAGYLTGNIIKYGRTVADVVGWTATSPFRYVMISAMGFARGAEAAKEARLKNEKVIEKTRVDDIDQAFEAAMRVREEAQKESGVGPEENPTKEALEKAYSRGIPKDILERLKKDPQPGIVSGIVQKISRWYVERSANNMEKKLDAIENDPRLNEAQKKNKGDKLLNRYSRRLKDLDRMVTKYGTVDNLALGAKAAELGAKAVVAGLMVESVYLAAQKLWEVGMPGLLSTLEQPPKAPPIPEIPETIEVQRGDSLWKIIERRLEAQYRANFADLNEAERTYLIDALKDKIVAEPDKYGLIDPDRLKIGQKINIGRLFKDKNWLDGLFARAESLTEADISNIKINNAILRGWVAEHPNRRLTSEMVEKILKGAPEAPGPPAAPRAPAGPPTPEESRPEAPLPPERRVGDERIFAEMVNKKNRILEIASRYVSLSPEDQLRIIKHLETFIEDYNKLWSKQPGQQAGKLGEGLFKDVFERLRELSNKYLDSLIAEKLTSIGMNEDYLDEIRNVKAVDLMAKRTGGVGIIDKLKQAAAGLTPAMEGRTDIFAENKLATFLQKTFGEKLPRDWTIGRAIREAALKGMRSKIAATSLAPPTPR